MIWLTIYSDSDICVAPEATHTSAKVGPVINCVQFPLDPCRAMKCRAKETCKIEKGEAVCVHDYMGTCMGSQSLQYHTFDGMTVDIQGGCTYTVAKYCGQDPTLVPFLVEEKKSEGNFKEWLTNVLVYGYNISIHKGEGGKIQVFFFFFWAVAALFWTKPFVESRSVVGKTENKKKNKRRSTKNTAGQFCITNQDKGSF